MLELILTLLFSAQVALDPSPQVSDPRSADAQLAEQLNITEFEVKLSKVLNHLQAARVLDKANRDGTLMSRGKPLVTLTDQQKAQLGTERDAEIGEAEAALDELKAWQAAQ